jgi:uncharacterized protein (TIGR03437 family)
LLLPQFVLASSPILSYATYLAGGSAQAIAVDQSGNAYVGLTGSVVKLDPTGSHLLATYSLPPAVTVTGIALDSSGNLVVTGNLESASTSSGYLAKFDSTGKSVFASTVPALASANGLALDSAANIYVAGTIAVTSQNSDAVVAKFAPSGSMIYSFNFGGAKNDIAHAIAVDSSFNAYVTGETLSTDFPVTSGAAQSKFAGGVSAPGYGAYGDAFVAKVDPTGSKLLFATYWGGSSSDVAYALAVDAQGSVYIAGGTSSADFPTTAGAFQTKYAGPAADPTAPDPAGDAFVAKFSSTGAPMWSTYWGGASADVAYAITLDAAGNIYFAGTSESFADFPSAGPALASCRRTGGPFAAALDPTGAKLLHSTGMSGLGYDDAYALALDASGAIYLAGDTTSRVFFATPAALQTTFADGESDAFAARLDLTQSGTYAACLLNGASFSAGNFSSFPLGTVAPGEIVSIFGSGIGPAVAAGLQLTGAGAVSTSLAGVTVTFDGNPAPLLYVSASQINAVVPYEVTGSTTQMSVTFNGQTYGPVAMPVAAAVPAIFTSTQTGHGQAAVLNQDGSLNSISNPAARGSVITFYAEGAGAMSPGVADGSVTTGPTLPSPSLPVTVSIRGIGATVQYAGAAPGYVSGLMQVNVLVPTSIDFGNLVPLTLNVGSFFGQFDVTIALK